MASKAAVLPGAAGVIKVDQHAGLGGPEHAQVS
jgi:hypothetical protein